MVMRPLGGAASGGSKSFDGAALSANPADLGPGRKNQQAAKPTLPAIG